MKYLAVRVEYGRHVDGEIGKRDTCRQIKNRYEDEFFVPGLQSYFKHWNASEFVIRNGYTPDQFKGLRKAYYLKANMFKTLKELDYDKVVFFDNDIQVVDWQYNVWELPTLTGFNVRKFEKVFNKNIGLNFGLVVFDRETICKFSELDTDQFKDHKFWMKKIGIPFDEYVLLSHINATGLTPNFINNILPFGHNFFKQNKVTPKFIHWGGGAWL